MSSSGLPVGIAQRTIQSGMLLGLGKGAVWAGAPNPSVSRGQLSLPGEGAASRALHARFVPNDSSPKLSVKCPWNYSWKWEIHVTWFKQAPCEGSQQEVCEESFL